MVTPRPRSALALLGFITTALVACGGNAQDAASQPVAIVGSDTLTQDDLVGFLSHAPTLPSKADAVSLTQTWINLGLINDLLNHPDQISSAAEQAAPTIREDLLVTRLAGHRAGQGRTATTAEIDSVIRLGVVRSFDAYGIPIKDSTEIQGALQILGELRTTAIGEGSLNNAYQALPATTRKRFALTRLPAVSRTDLASGLAEELWKLDVGQITPVMAGAGGLQVMVRRSSRDFADDVAAWLRPQIQETVDADFVDSLAQAAGLSQGPDLVKRVRAALGSGDGKVPGTEPVVKWNGGSLTSDAVSLRLASIDPNEWGQLASGPDTAIVDRVMRMGRREILAARAREVLPDSDEVTAGRLADSLFSAGLDSIRTSRSRVEQGTANPSTSAWMTAIVLRQVPPQRLPGTLSGVLREQYGVELNEAALERALRESVRTWTGPGSGPAQAQS